MSIHLVASWLARGAVIAVLFGQCGDCPTQLRCRTLNLVVWCQTAGAGQCQIPPQPVDLDCHGGRCSFVVFDVDADTTMIVPLGSLAAELAALPVIVIEWSGRAPSSAQIVLELDDQPLSCDVFMPGRNGFEGPRELRCRLPALPAPPSELRMTVLSAPSGFFGGPYSATISLSEQTCTEEIEVCGL